VREEGEFLEEQAFVPHAAVSVALLLALLSIGVLVYFIHHVSDAARYRCGHWRSGRVTTYSRRRTTRSPTVTAGRPGSGGRPPNCRLPTVSLCAPIVAGM
jgi:hypothetical protein